MANDVHNIDLINTRGSRWKFSIHIVAAIGIFLVAYAYADAVLIKNDMQAAFIFTAYFLSCIYTGQYISRLWIGKNNFITKKMLATAAAISLVSAILVFVLAELAKNLTLVFIKIVFIGLPFTVLSLSLGVLIKFIRSSISNQLLIANAAAEQRQVELRSLQNQLSPHFLFNTLNNMYGISLTQHEKIPGLLLKLSDLLRYAVYDAKEMFVPLQNEVAYIKDYIDFEKIRIGDKLDLHVKIEQGIDPFTRIAPLLLIVFIENAFKHAKNTIEEKIFIRISLKLWDDTILFAVKNSGSSNSGESSVIKKDSGFGLENVKKRLELLYSGAYDLKVEEKEGYYNVMLQLKAK